MVKKSRSRRRKKVFERKQDKIYFDGVVIEALPGVRFKVKIDRGETLEPLIIDCMTRTILKVKRVKILKGDAVTVEIDPEDLSKGVIVERNLDNFR